LFAERKVPRPADLASYSAASARASSVSPLMFSPKYRATPTLTLTSRFRALIPNGRAGDQAPRHFGQHGNGSGERRRFVSQASLLVRPEYGALVGAFRQAARWPTEIITLCAFSEPTP